MDLALVTLPVETATVLATCAEAWVMADMAKINTRVVVPTTTSRDLRSSSRLERRRAVVVERDPCIIALYSAVCARI